MRIFRTKKEILNEALYSTYYKTVKNDDERSGRKQASGALYSYIKHGNPQYFSNVCNGRNEIVKAFTRSELAHQIAKEYVEKMLDHDIDSEIGMQILFMDEKEAIEQVADCLLSHRNCFGNLSANRVSTVVCEDYANSIIDYMKQRDTVVARNVEKKLREEKPQYGVRNVKIENRNLLNRCREQVLSGEQIAYQNREKKEISYNLNDELLADSSIGYYKEDQQDSVLLLYHPSNPNYKMLVVADGVGGSVDGARASQEVVKQMIEWFERLNPDVLRGDDLSTLQSAWNAKLVDINNQIREDNSQRGGAKKDDSSSTFVGAIIGEKSTMVASLGDSRCYAYGVDDQLHQLTVDDNIEYRAFQERLNEYLRKVGRPLTEEEKVGIAAEKDDLRFNRGANKITQCLGFYETIQPQFVTLPNKDYRTLMLFSDGVTDCLSDSQILGITRNTDKKFLARRLVTEALRTESRRERRSDALHRDIIFAGKDNTTAAVYHNKEADKGDER